MTASHYFDSDRDEDRIRGKRQMTKRPALGGEEIANHLEVVEVREINALEVHAIPKHRAPYAVDPCGGCGMDHLQTGSSLEASVGKGMRVGGPCEVDGL